jgi:uncharacterized protein YneF (UPF0154 family)
MDIITLLTGALVGLIAGFIAGRFLLKKVFSARRKEAQEKG